MNYKDSASHREKLFDKVADEFSIYEWTYIIIAEEKSSAQMPDGWIF